MSRTFSSVAPAVALGLAVFGLAACDTRDVLTARQSAVDIVGMSEASVIACAGSPTRRYSDEAGSHLVYVLEDRLREEAGPPPQYGLAGASLRAQNSVLPPPSQNRELRCEANLLSRDGRIVQVDYRTNGSTILCGRIMKRCTK